MKGSGKCYLAPFGQVVRLSNRHVETLALRGGLVVIIVAGYRCFVAFSQLDVTATNYMVSSVILYPYFHPSSVLLECYTNECLQHTQTSCFQESGLSSRTCPKCNHVLTEPETVP